MALAAHLPLLLAALVLIASASAQLTGLYPPSYGPGDEPAVAAPPPPLYGPGDEPAVAAPPPPTYGPGDEPAVAAPPPPVYGPSSPPPPSFPDSFVAYYGPPPPSTNPDAPGYSAPPPPGYSDSGAYPGPPPPPGYGDLPTVAPPIPFPPPSPAPPSSSPPSAPVPLSSPPPLDPNDPHWQNGSLGESCYDITDIDISFLDLVPCDGELPAKVCLGNKYFHEGDVLYQLWFRFENGSKAGFASTNHGTWEGMPISFLATTDRAHCVFKYARDVSFDLTTKPPPVLAKETCTADDGTVTEKTVRWIWATPAFPYCTPDLVEAGAPVIATAASYEQAASGSGQAAQAARTASQVSRPAVTSAAMAGIVAAVVVAVVAVMAGTVLLVRARRNGRMGQKTQTMEIRAQANPLYGP